MNKENISNEILINEDLILLDLSVDKQEDVLLTLSNKLLELGYVTVQFFDSICKREEQYPTGIKTNSIGVAIPHTDIDFVNQGAIVVGVLKESVYFREMVTQDEIAVKIVFMLAFKKSDHQLKILQGLMNILQDDKSLEAITNAKEKGEVVTILRSIIVENGQFPNLINSET